MADKIALLKKCDPRLAEITGSCGSIYVSPGFQGRIFCSIDGRMVHNLVETLAEHPHPDQFNNLGGNSLWPAPEGGNYAFNYLPGSDAWLVQDGINKVNPEMVFRHPDSVGIEKEITLLNRKGTSVKLSFRRTVLLKPENGDADRCGLRRLAYYAEDSLIPLGKYSEEDLLLGAWSLEQFPGGAGILAFGRLDGDSRTCINDDFYGDASPRLSYTENLFKFKLGGTDRLQIGIKCVARPALIGALDAARELLFIRKAAQQDGRYFNIADNAQKNGPWSAADRFSIFNGAGLGFYELETIAPMHVENGLVKGSCLTSETIILSGPEAKLKKYLAEKENVVL